MMVFAWFRLTMELPVLRDVPLGTRATTLLALYYANHVFRNGTVPQVAHFLEPQTPRRPERLGDYTHGC